MQPRSCQRGGPKGWRKTVWPDGHHCRKQKATDESVFAHPLGPLPWALANGDGSLRKTNKAALARELEMNVSQSHQQPSLMEWMWSRSWKGITRPSCSWQNQPCPMSFMKGPKAVYREISVKDAERSNHRFRHGHPVQEHCTWAQDPAVEEAPMQSCQQNSTD